MVDGDDTYDGGGRAEARRAAGRTATSTWWSARASRPHEAAYRAGHRLRQRGADRRSVGAAVRPQIDGHAVGLPRVLAPVRQELPVARRASSRSRPSSPCTRCRCGWRSPRCHTNYKERPPGSDEQAAHVPRRLADPAHDHEPDAQRAAAAVLLPGRHCPLSCCRWHLSSRWCLLTWRLAWCRGCRPRCWSPASCWSRCCRWCAASCCTP